MRYTWALGQAQYDPTEQSMQAFVRRNIDPNNRTHLELRTDALDFFVFRKGARRFAPVEFVNCGR